MKTSRFIVTFTLLAACSAFADKVTLVSGSFLTGKAGLIQDGKLAFASDDLGSVNIDIAKIASLEADNDHVIQWNDNTRETLPVTVKDGKLALRDGGEFAAENVKATDPAVETWHGSVNLSAQSARGNTYRNSATLLANVNRRWERDRFSADAGYYYSETGTSKDDRKKSTDRYDLAAQHDHFWLTKVYSYEKAKYEVDRIADLKYRLTVGAGLGYQWLEGYNEEYTGKWSFNQEAGATYVRNSYEVRRAGVEDGYVAARYAHHLKYNPKWNPGVEGFHNLEFLPQVDDWENHLIKADIGFTTKLIMNFDLLCKIEWDYNSRPSAGRKSSDVRYIAGLGYKW